MIGRKSLGHQKSMYNEQSVGHRAQAIWLMDHLASKNSPHNDSYLSIVCVELRLLLYFLSKYCILYLIHVTT